MVIFTICSLIFIAIIWPRAFFNVLGGLIAIITIGLFLLLYEIPEAEQQRWQREAAQRIEREAAARRAEAQETERQRQAAKRRQLVTATQ